MTGTCIWCGLEMIDDTTQDTVYACGSMQHSSSDVWSQSTGCEEIMRLRDRIRRALEKLNDDDAIPILYDSETGWVVDLVFMEAVRTILAGGVEITTD